MPYKISERDGKFCVVKKDGSVVKCHDTETLAKKHLAALAINVEEANFSQVFSMCIELFGDGDDMLQRVLSGEYVEIMDNQGFYDHWGVWRDIDDDVLAMFTENWEKRLDRGIRRSKLAVDADHDGKALGWYKDIKVLASGRLGASFSWNKRGREELEDGTYAYFSPTVYWALPDHKTGETVRYQIGGGALTNYPYFGELTALYDLRSSVAYSTVLKKEPDGLSYPSRAYLSVGDPQKVATWHMRAMSYQDGTLLPDHGLMAEAKEKISYGEPGTYDLETLSRLEAMYSTEGLESKKDGGSAKMEDTDALKLGVKQKFALALLGIGEGGDVDPEVFAALGVQQGVELKQLEAKLAEFTAKVDGLEAARKKEREQAETEISELTKRLSTAERARGLATFVATAQSEFNHLPGEASDLAEHLFWLDLVDQSEGKAHFAFFKGLLAEADKQFEAQFSELGVGRGSEPTIEGLIAAHLKDNPEATYSEAAEAVLRDNPGLYETYSAKVAEGN